VLLFRPGPLLDAISQASLARLSNFTEQNLANTAWSFAKLARMEVPLREAISSAAVARISQFFPQALANMAWSWATLVCRDLTLL
jgi:C4-dicarboxylate-specific signal transduction histidine kinase